MFFNQLSLLLIKLSLLFYILWPLSSISIIISFLLWLFILFAISKPSFSLHQESLWSIFVD